MVVDQKSQIIMYVINDIDQIVEVGGNWNQFALENKGISIDIEKIKSKMLWDFIDGSGVRYLYRLLLGKVRESNRKITIPLRCDSSICRRFMELQIERLQNETVRFISRLLRLEERPAVDMLDPDIPKSENVVKICSWCKKINHGKRWYEIEDGIKKMNLFGVEALPTLSHGVCRPCKEFVLNSLRDA